MGKKVIMVLLVGLALASFRLADAQQPKKIAKIAYLVRALQRLPRLLSRRSGKGCGSLATSKGKLLSWSFAMARPKPNDFRRSHGS